MRLYERIDKTSENREKPRSYYIPYDTLEKALSGDRTKSAYYKLLKANTTFPKKSCIGQKQMYRPVGR